MQVWAAPGLARPISSVIIDGSGFLPLLVLISVTSAFVLEVTGIKLFLIFSWDCFHLSRI